MKVSPARKSAYDALWKIEKENAFSSIVLPIYEENLSKQDRSLCHEIVLGTLRKKLYLDELIKTNTNKKINKFDLEVLIALRIAIYQLVFLDKIPAYSAINESVNLVKIARKKSASGLVNAVLRKISKGNIELKPNGKLAELSINTSHPKWLIDKWVGQFGIDETIKFANSNNEIPRMAFRFTNKFYTSRKEKQNAIVESFQGNTTKSELIIECFIAAKFDDNLSELAQKGYIYFQEEGSQLIAESVNLKDGETFLDVCASPGSKVTYVARNNNSLVGKKTYVAGDFHTHRIRNLRDNCFHQSVEFVDLVQYDAKQDLPFADESFDVVLIDAPCSGTGTIRNNPEIRYKISEDDISVLSSKQLTIVKNASKTIRPGGRLIYSTCSLEVEENEDVITTFLEMNNEFEVIKPPVANKFLTDDNFARTFPHRDNMDGFFIAVLVHI